MKHKLINIFLTFSFVLFAGLASATIKVDTKEFALIPVMHEGRVKPVGTFAQIKLKALHGKTSIEGLSDVEWLAEVLFYPKQAYSRKVFKISNNDVKAALSLNYKEKYFSFIEIYSAFNNNQQLISELFASDPANLDLTSTQIKELYNLFTDYLGLSRSFSLMIPEFKTGYGQMFSYYDIATNKGLEKSLKGVESFKSFMEEDAQFNAFTVVPHKQGKDGDTLWLSPWKTLMEKNSAELAGWNQLYLSYFQKGDAFKDESIRLQNTQTLGKFKAELLLRKYNLVHYSIFFYVLSFLALSLSFLKNHKIIRWISYSALFSGGLIHLGLVTMRSFILGRPPVTNLYESIIFVGLTSVVFALGYEWKRKNSLGLFVGSVLGAVLLFLSIGYEQSGDNFSMLVAVLDTNFWLATHVVTISIGYGCALVASLMSHFYLFQMMNRAEAKTLTILEKNIHGTVLYALFFTVLGTILGGIWADQSWGRFWGWDPKENGALLICLWLLWVTHAKLAGKFKKASFAYFTGLSSIIVIMAWFGVNLLNVGLHTYGFSSDAARGLFLFSGGEILILTILYYAGKRQDSGSLAV